MVEKLKHMYVYFCFGITKMIIKCKKKQKVLKMKKNR